MTDNHFKQLYAFVLLILTILWGAFAVMVTYRAVISAEAKDVILSAGVDTLLGALIVWTGNVNQFYFRKAPEEKH